MVVLASYSFTLFGSLRFNKKLEEKLLLKLCEQKLHDFFLTDQLSFLISQFIRSELDDYRQEKCF